MTMTAERTERELTPERLDGTYEVDGVECVVYRVPTGRIKYGHAYVDEDHGTFEPHDEFDVFQARFADEVTYWPGWVRAPYQSGPGIWHHWNVQAPRVRNRSGFLADGPTLDKALAAAKRRLRKIKADTNALLALRGVTGVVYSDHQYAQLPEAPVVFVGDLVALPALGKWRIGVVERISRTGNATIAYSTPSNAHRVHRVTRSTLGLRCAR